MENTNLEFRGRWSEWNSHSFISRRDFNDAALSGVETYAPRLNCLFWADGEDVFTEFEVRNDRGRVSG
jgi:hypothetical protein